MTKLKYRVIWKDKIIGFIEHIDFMSGDGLKFYTGKSEDEVLEPVSKIAEIVVIDTVKYEQFLFVGKDGAEIYQNDIIRAINDHGMWTHSHVAYWPDDEYDMQEWGIHEDDVEKIGNIHENPDLA